MISRTLVYCNQCGLELPDNYKFCPKCGTELTLDDKAEKTDGKFSKKETIPPTEIKKAKKRINRQTILIGISVPIVLFVLIGIISVALNGSNTISSSVCGTIDQGGNVQQQIDDCVNSAVNDNSLTDNQKSIIKDMQKNCDDNEAVASMQSDSAAKGYHRMCYDKIYDQIQQFKQANTGNKTS